MFWAIIGGILLASYLLLSHLGEKSSFVELLKKVFVAFVAAVGIPVALLIVVSFALDYFPGHVFKSSFEFAPTSDVTELMGKKSRFGDSGSTYLRFHANKRTLERIIGSRFVEIDENRFRRQTEAELEYAPDYWHPFEGKPTHFYEANKFDESFGFNYAVMSYDETNGLIHFYWTGVN
jgi:hypothetical protein